MVPNPSSNPLAIVQYLTILQIATLAPFSSFKTPRAKSTLESEYNGESRGGKCTIGPEGYCEEEECYDSDSEDDYVQSETITSRRSTMEGGDQTSSSCHLGRYSSSGESLREPHKTKSKKQ